MSEDLIRAGNLQFKFFKANIFSLSVCFLHWTVILRKFTKKRLVKNIPTRNFNFRTAKLPLYFHEAKQVLNILLKIMKIVLRPFVVFFFHLVSFVKLMNHDWVTRRLWFFIFDTNQLIYGPWWNWLRGRGLSVTWKKK